MTLRMTVKFEQDGKVFRSMAVEGNEADVAHSLAALYAEWEKHIPVGNPSETLMPTPTPEELQAALDLGYELERRYGRGIFAKMEKAMDDAADRLKDKFMDALRSGEMTIHDLPGFVLASIRAEFLGILPDFPESLLDRVVTASAAPLNAHFNELLRQHNLGGRK